MYMKKLTVLPFVLQCTCRYNLGNRELSSAILQWKLEINLSTFICKYHRAKIILPAACFSRRANVALPGMCQYTWQVTHQSRFMQLMFSVSHVTSISNAYLNPRLHPYCLEPPPNRGVNWVGRCDRGRIGSHDQQLSDELSNMTPPPTLASYSNFCDEDPTCNQRPEGDFCLLIGGNISGTMKF